MSLNVPDGEHTKNVAILNRDMCSVVRDIDRNEYSTCDDSDGKEKPTEEAKEAEEYNRIKSDFVEKVGFFGVNKWWNPGENTIRNRRWLLVANMVFNLWLVYHLAKHEDENKTQEPKWTNLVTRADDIEK